MRARRFGLVRFAVVVALLTVVFLFVGPVLGSLHWLTGSNLPGAALAVVCPTIAAVVLSVREKSLPRLGASLRLPRVRWEVWVVAALAMPAVVFAASFATGRVGGTFPGILGVALIAGSYLFGAVAEELGWTGYALPRLLELTGEVRSGLILGVFWAAWHVIPYLQAGNGARWIVGQCLFSIALRMLLVRLSVGARLSIWPAVIGHATYNLAWSLSPDGGAGYDPWVAAAFTAALVAVLYLLRWRRDRVAGVPSSLEA